LVVHVREEALTASQRNAGQQRKVKLLAQIPLRILIFNPAKYKSVWIAQTLKKSVSVIAVIKFSRLCHQEFRFWLL